ncbi:MAG: hypothetical protein KGJ58_01125 [Patescibacteria group bacterium]|nr:hypothetical protein [Patescibacteria group bacterium]
MLKEDYGIWLENITRADYSRHILPVETEIFILGGGIANNWRVMSSDFFIENKKIYAKL